jgi:hypothetical protein
MKFDLHSELANQITIENLKWHRDGLAADLGKEHAFIHDEDQQYYEQLLTHLNVVIGYFTIEGTE